MFAKQHGLLYVETSAKEGWGVEDAFEKSAREVLERIQKGAFETRKVSRSHNEPANVSLLESRSTQGRMQSRSRVGGAARSLPGHVWLYNCTT
jgi:hypothetical protein